MAKQVKPTPVLTGEEARKFEKQANENTKRNVPEAEYRRAVNAYNNLRFVKA